MVVSPTGDTDRAHRELAPDRDVDQSHCILNAVFGAGACVDVLAYSDIPGSAPGARGTTANDAVSALSCSACCDPLKLPTLDRVLDV